MSMDQAMSDVCNFALFAVTATFGVLEWSPTEDRLLFIAERHRPKAISYFDKGSKFIRKIYCHTPMLSLQVMSHVRVGTV